MLKCITYKELMFYCENCCVQIVNFSKKPLKKYIYIAVSSNRISNNRFILLSTLIVLWVYNLLRIEYVLG